MSNKKEKTPLLKDVWESRDLIFSLAKSDFKAKYAGSVFGIIWALAVIGTLLKIFTSPSGTKWWSIGLYLLMGWLVIFVSGKLFASISATAITFLALGGIFYTVGVLFYVKKNWMYSHAIWHSFVLLGTIMHFFSILFACVVRI